MKLIKIVLLGIGLVSFAYAEKPADMDLSELISGVENHPFTQYGYNNGVSYTKNTDYEAYLNHGGYRKDTKRLVHSVLKFPDGTVKAFWVSLSPVALTIQVEDPEEAQKSYQAIATAYEDQEWKPWGHTTPFDNSELISLPFDAIAQEVQMKFPITVDPNQPTLVGFLKNHIAVFENDLYTQYEMPLTLLRDKSLNYTLVVSPLRVFKFQNIEGDDRYWAFLFQARPNGIHCWVHKGESIKNIFENIQNLAYGKSTESISINTDDWTNIFLALIL